MSRIRVKTKSGSVYEIDEMGKRARRLSGPPRTMSANEWRIFVVHSKIDLGMPLYFAWKSGDETMTSPIVSVEREYA